MSPQTLRYVHITLLLTKGQEQSHHASTINPHVSSGNTWNEIEINTVHTMDRIQFVI